MTRRFENEANGEPETNGKMEQAAMRTESELDLELELALKDFKSSVHAWSDAAFSRSRTWTLEVRRRSWRLALGWALGCLLVVGSVSGGLLERHHRMVVAQIVEQQRIAEQQRQLREKQLNQTTDEALLAGVDSDVSRQVPSAMEPLAQMMSDDETK